MTIPHWSHILDFDHGTGEVCRIGLQGHLKLHTDIGTIQHTIPLMPTHKQETSHLEMSGVIYIYICIYIFIYLCIYIYSRCSTYIHRCCYPSHFNSSHVTIPQHISTSNCSDVNLGLLHQNLWGSMDFHGVFAWPRGTWPQGGAPIDMGGAQRAQRPWSWNTQEVTQCASDALHFST